MKLTRDTCLEIDLDIINKNISEIKRYISKNTKLAIVVKADAYGHGAVEVCNNIDKNNVDYICVATLSEGLELRKNNIDLPILVMGYTPDNYLDIAIQNDITVTIFSLKQANIIDYICKQKNIKGKVHIKIDTGFNRLGFKLNENTIEDIKNIINLKNIYIEGIFTHLALKDKKCDYEQFEQFKKILDKIPSCKEIPIKHICDSIGMVAYKNFHLDMVRVGSSIYGYNSRKSSLNLCEAMTFKSKIIQVKRVLKGEGISYDYSYIAYKDMNIGIIPCGYADGIPRCLSNKGYVYINNKKCNIIGKICMDQMIIDISNISEKDYDKEVIFYGKNGPSLLEVANLCGTNRNEILTLPSRRVDRIYLKNNKVLKKINYILGEN
ncbi:alanine racemase [Paraclostridium ghonii]|uniref:Alanine racemase n=1 Tax=Paraclostridium ghonii TaxID=29358 RepID=A0ABU0MX16_9FIRM|nr:alanine racemase [Paeniclostridium ghonii]MDQ0555452.1 alanine racemase [Paeniclostridium ghonii]